MSYPRPFLSVFGTKTNSVAQLLPYVRTRFNVYYEPFFHDVGFFFSVRRCAYFRSACLSSLSRRIVNIYVGIRDAVDEVISLLREFWLHEEVYYGLLRKDIDDFTLAERAAHAIFQNWESHKNQLRMDNNWIYYELDNLGEVSRVLQDVKFVCCSFEQAQQAFRSGDFVYFDPPYLECPEADRALNYNRGMAWEYREHEQLRNALLKLTGLGVYIMLTTLDVEPIRQLYGSSPFYTVSVPVTYGFDKHHVKARDIVVTNYPIAKQLSIFEVS